MALTAENLNRLPQKPGVYLFKDARGEVLYVGKAKNLKNRIRSYFAKSPEGQAPRTALLVAELVDLDYIIVSSELESLMLENNLIKQYQPRFNVRLRDDKNYQFLKIDYEQEIPQIYPVRKVDKTSTKNKYFGPYTSGGAVKQTLKLLRRLFNLCGNKKVSRRACFQYHLGRCPGVCLGRVSLLDYRKSLMEAEKFLNHKQIELIKTLKREMRSAAEHHKFEKAAALRDKIKSLESLWEKQKIVSARKLSQDYFGLFVAGPRAIVNLFLVRDGKLIHQETFELAQTEGSPPEEILESWLKQYYSEASNLPKELITRYRLPDRDALQKWLWVKIINPKRGNKLKLLALAEENAEDYYGRTIASFERVLTDLQNLLHLPRPPGRIEAYDVSNIQGFLPVGSLVVFEQGLPKKTDYRKFKIRLKEKPDDVGMMKEMLLRRFSHSSPSPHEGRVREGLQSWPLPDLIIIDGGKGQLNAALSVLSTYHLQLPVIGLAKRLEEIFLPGKKDGIRLSPDSPMLHLLQRIRDEAHRFAITFYRVRHRREGARSRLDEISGVGSVTKKKLLQRFGTLSTIRNTSLEALAKEIGPALAKKIKEAL